MRGAALVVLAGISLMGPVPAHAGVTLSAAAQREEEVETGLRASGYGTSLSFDYGPYFFLGANYSNLRTDSFEDALDGVEGRLEYRSWGADAGGVWAWTEQVGLTGTVGYAASHTRGLDGFHNDRPARFQGPTGSLTLWYQPDSLVAFTFGSGYSYIGAEPGWDTSAGVGLRVWGQVWLDTAYWRGEGSDGWTAGLRRSFPAN